MACKPDPITKRTYLLATKAKIPPQDFAKPHVSCSFQPAVPLHGEIKCKPQGVLKFEPLPPIVRYQNRECTTQRFREIEKRALDARKKRRHHHGPLPPIDKRSLATPPALDGRLHQKVQTEMYLEELKDFREERNNYCQTDLFIDRPPTPYFIPEKIGLDKETQIYDGELFDFDVEVLPVLEVLVGKVVEQALLEVQEEEELAALREQQRIFEELRNADFQEQQRLEEQERRIKQEKMERLKQEISRQKRAKQLDKKISAIAYSKGYIGSLISGTFGDLIAGKYFYDDKEKDIELNFWTQLLVSTRSATDVNVLGRRVLDKVIREVVNFRFNVFKMIDSSNYGFEDEIEIQGKGLRQSVRAESFDPTDTKNYLKILPKADAEREFVVQQIKNIFFLKHMPMSYLTAIADGLSERKVHANENIYVQGDVGDEFYIVKSGKFDVIANGSKMASHEDFGYFGEMALMYNATRRATVKATTDGLLWFMKRSNFKQLMATTDHLQKKGFVELLKKVNIFKYMTELEYEKTAEAVRYVTFKDGDVVVKQGDKADSLIIIDGGKAKLITVSESHPEGQVNYIERGHYFGELALLSDIVRSSTVLAFGDLGVLILEKDTFERMVGSCQDIVNRNPKKN